ncbi:MAG: hypothetical protein WBB29_11995 [Geitlerinemataceae cyanobacterium]
MTEKPEVIWLPTNRMQGFWKDSLTGNAILSSSVGMDDRHLAFRRVPYSLNLHFDRCSRQSALLEPIC